MKEKKIEKISDIFGKCRINFGKSKVESKVNRNDLKVP